MFGLDRPKVILDEVDPAQKGLVWKGCRRRSGHGRDEGRLQE